jgi:hypothetical protein
MSAHDRVLLGVLLAAGFGLAGCGARQDAVPGGSASVERAPLPDWRGFWIAKGQTPDISGFPAPKPLNELYPLAGFDASWNEAARARLPFLADPGSRKAAGWGYPMMMNSSAPMQFLITPDETLIVNMYREVRHIYTDGRELPAEVDRWATTWGDSVGRWEGDTLVIDTVSVRDPLRFFFFAPPLSEQAHYVERLRKTGPDRIEMQMTVEDPATLTAPWTIKLAYMRAPQLDRLIHDDFDNDRTGIENGVFTIESAPER